MIMNYKVFRTIFISLGVGELEFHFNSSNEDFFIGLAPVDDITGYCVSFNNETHNYKNLKEVLNAPIFNNANKYNMVNIVDYGDLSIRCKYKRKIDSEIDLDSDIIKKKNKLYSIYLRSTWKKLLRGYDEYLLLYVAKYGLEKNRTGKF